MALIIVITDVKAESITVSKVYRGSVVGIRYFYANNIVDGMNKRI